jgi:hypothetical protein
MPAEAILSLRSELAVGGTAGLVLLLGAVGVLNISTVC